MHAARLLPVSILLLGLIPVTASGVELRDVIDQQVEAMWKSQNITPVGLSTDGEFCAGFISTCSARFPRMRKLRHFWTIPIPTNGPS